MRILYLIPTLDIGGAEVDVVRWAPHLDRKRFQPIVWPFVHHGPLATPLREAGVPVLPPLARAPHRPEPAALEPQAPDAAFLQSAPTRHSDWWMRTAGPIAQAWHFGRVATAIARGIKAAQADVVHAILPNAYLLGAGSNLIARRPLVMSRVSQNWYQKDARLFGLMERQLAHRMVRIAVGNSAVLLDELRAEGIAGAKLRLVRNGIDAAGFQAQLICRDAARHRLGLDPSALVLSAVANLHPYKGHSDVLHALAMMRDALPADWRLLVAGRDTGGRLAELTGLAAKLGLSSHVRLLGERQDIPIILSAADIHVSASHTEGFPNNILEAMCARLPVVATAVGGVPEQIQHGHNGLLTLPQNPGSLAQAIHMVAQDGEMRDRLGAAARETVRQQFAIERTVAALEAIYAEVQRPRRPGPGADV